MPRPAQPTLYWDCETRSTVDLRRAGVYVYAAHPDTSVTLARLAIGGEPPVEWRPGQRLPDRFRAALEDHKFRIVAHNAAFERIILRDILAPRHGWPEVPVWRWDCTMARARVQALPGSLNDAAIAIGLDVKKDQKGYSLMLRMCRPRSTLVDGTPVWWEDEERMLQLSDYCSIDVKVERALDGSLRAFPPGEKEAWEQTEVMNDRGVCFDLDFVRAAKVIAEETRVVLDDVMAELTEGRVKQASRIKDLKRYLLAQGVDLSQPPELQRDTDLVTEEVVEVEEDEEPEEESLPDMRRRDVIRLLADPRVGEHERDVLNVRLEAGKISVRKLDAIAERADAEGVVRGMLGYHGANTGRYISHGVQIQNFPRDVVADWEGVRNVMAGGGELVNALVGPPLDVISKMLRGSIIARPGFEIASGDYSSVEACGVAWLSGQTDLLDAFMERRKIYEEMAARVFGMRAADVAPDSWQRHVGKTLVLGAGYQMGWWKFRETVLAMGGVLLSPEDAQRAVTVYRDTFPRIPKLWFALQDGAVEAVGRPGVVISVHTGLGAKVAFLKDGQWLRMKLPSGRYLWYNQPLLEPGKFGGKMVTYMQVNPKSKKWERGHTYGGRLTENAVQGLCRDLMVHGTLRLEDEGYRPIALVHDEIICEPPVGHGSVPQMLDVMCQLPVWAERFPLSAKGRRGPRYVK
jgi:DNA polymerase